jgi:hypothetical protein
MCQFSIILTAIEFLGKEKHVKRVWFIDAECEEITGEKAIKGDKRCRRRYSVEKYR